MDKRNLFFAAVFILVSNSVSASRDMVRIVLNASRYFMENPGEQSVIQTGIQTILEKQTKKQFWLKVILPECPEMPVIYSVVREHGYITSLRLLSSNL